MMLLSEAAGYMNGELLSDEEARVTCVGSDSRHITQGELFFAFNFLVFFVAFTGNQHNVGWFSR